MASCAPTQHPCRGLEKSPPFGKYRHQKLCSGFATGSEWFFQLQPLSFSSLHLKYLSIERSSLSWLPILKLAGRCEQVSPYFAGLTYLRTNPQRRPYSNNHCQIDTQVSVLRHKFLCSIFPPERSLVLTPDTKWKAPRDNSGICQS